MRFELISDWCASEMHLGERRPWACVMIGGIAICEDCVLAYANGWDEALGNWFDVEEHRRDLVHAVSCATRLVLGLEAP